MKFIDPSNDPWRRVVGADASVPSPRARCLLTLEQWQAVRGAWPTGLSVGVIVPNDADIEALAPDLPPQRDNLAVVVLEFPKWVDGRAYSQARLLRARLRFGGEIRATGQVLADMLPLLQRTGFDAAVLRADQNLATARRALDFFPGHYQADVTRLGLRLLKDAA